MTIADYYHWTPKTIGRMFCDDYDFEGLMYWYNEILRLNKESAKKK